MGKATVGPLVGHCAECGQELRGPLPGVGGASGYAVRPDDARVCYPCADRAQRAELARVPAGGPLGGAYVAGDGEGLTTWTGGPLGRVLWWGELHPWSRERRYVRVRLCDGREAYGTAAPGMWASLRVAQG